MRFRGLGVDVDEGDEDEEDEEADADDDAGLSDATGAPVAGVGGGSRVEDTPCGVGAADTAGAVDSVGAGGADGVGGVGAGFEAPVHIIDRRCR